MYYLVATLFFAGSLFLTYRAQQIKKVKNKQQEQYKQQLEEEIHQLQAKKDGVVRATLESTTALKKYNEQKLEEEIQEQRRLKEQILKNQLEQQRIKVSSEIKDIHRDLSNIRESAIKQKQQIQNDIKTLKASLVAGVQARLREQQINDKLDFYRLSVNKTDLADIKMLQNLKLSLHKPVILSKLIWTQYFQKQMTELCDRVLGKSVVCGIYKITNLTTEQCYIGQSVDVSKRWKDHCKCGLGIDASVTNKLYNAMQKDGVWNFTFELLEQCPKELLNEKESFWIQMYQSNTFGYNTTKGNKV